MNISTNFATNKSLDEIQEFTKYFFIKHGYRLVKATDECQEFTKGNRLKNYIVFNPLNWKNVVRIDYSRNGELNTKIKCIYEIDTSGQMITEKEEETWKKFSDNYQLSVSGGKYFDSNYLGKQTKKENLGVVFKALGLALGAGLIAGVITGLINHYFGYRLDLIPFVVGITMIYVFTKIGKVKK
jgi:hypothetical protein